MVAAFKAPVVQQEEIARSRIDPGLGFVLEFLDDATNACPSKQPETMMALLGAVDWHMVDHKVTATIVALLFADSAEGPDDDGGAAAYDQERRDAIVKACMATPGLFEMRNSAREDREANGQERGRYFSPAQVMEVRR